MSLANPNRVQACQSAGPHGVGRYDCSCPVIVPQGVQCRTMTSQRPCGAPQCTRPECKSGYATMSARVEAATKDSTENGSKGSESAPQTTGDNEPQGAPVRLTRDELWSVQRALVGRIMLYPYETALETALNKVSEALKTR